VDDYGCGRVKVGDAAGERAGVGVVLVADIVFVAVLLAVALEAGDADTVGDVVALAVGDAVALAVGDDVVVAVVVGVDVSVAVGLAVGVEVSVAVAVGVSVGVGVGVGVGRIQSIGSCTQMRVAVWPARAAVMSPVLTNLLLAGS
jgi:hypothetical protein